MLPGPTHHERVGADAPTPQPNFRPSQVSPVVGRLEQHRSAACLIGDSPVITSETPPVGSRRPRQSLNHFSAVALTTISEILEQRSRPRSAYLFCKANGSRIGNPRKAFENACRRAGTDDFRRHDLRHTFASWFVQEGGDLYRLSRILGHTTLQMSSRYAHLRTDDLHDELQRVSQKRSREHQTGTLKSRAEAEGEHAGRSPNR
ncbi:site-specific integrase [Methylobacterium sp. P5_C11]